MEMATSTKHTEPNIKTRQLNSASTNNCAAQVLGPSFSDRERARASVGWVQRGARVASVWGGGVPAARCRQTA